jgi:hypothetical protein
VKLLLIILLILTVGALITHNPYADIGKRQIVHWEPNGECFGHKMKLSCSGKVQFEEE